MSKRHCISTGSNKRGRTSAVRFRIPLDFPGSSAPQDVRQSVMLREERLQQGTGLRYRSKRQIVDEDPWLPVENAEIGLDLDSTKSDKALSADFADAEKDAKIQQAKREKKKWKRKRSLASARPMIHWKNSYRDIYLDEMLRWEGRGDSWSEAETPCNDCRAQKVEDPPAGIYRCQDCFVPHLLCKNCIIRRHRILPLHVIFKWTGTTFVKSSLKDLGLRIQLNHQGMSCSKPEPCHSSLVIMHTNGLHEVSLNFCGCRPLSKIRQLLRRGLYPSSQNNPRTCATFSLLNHMHILNLTSKCSTYDYYKALEKLTNNTGINLPRLKYRPLLRIILQWRHLKMLKRAGRGHDASGAAGTKAGELALLCPSCPHPGVNLPDDWQNESLDRRFLYFIILCMDANFRLKNQLVSNYSVDPGLGRGLSYTVEREPFEHYVKSRAKDVDMVKDDRKGCGLQAVDQANTRYSKGLRYTGVSSVSCGRSEMIMPCSVGNLHKGERYANMDYGLASTLRFLTALLFIMISYDAACQWFINFGRRVEDYWHEQLKPPKEQSFVPLIPKLHEKGHKNSKKKQHEQFSFNLCKGVGHSDGEGPERIWSGHNSLGNATKTMGPGSRHDVLDDHFGHWNYEKYVGMGKTLMKRYRKAVPERNRQTEAHNGFSATLNPADVASWTKMCETWETDAFPRTAENPYYVEGTNLTQEQVLKELADEESKRIASGGVLLHETGPSVFLNIGMELEDSQRRLAWIVKNKEKDSSSIAEERTLLRKEIESWKKLQTIYMPGLIQYVHNQEKLKPGSTVDGENSENMRLWFPSMITKAEREVVCVPGLSNAEERLRTAECYDSLEGVCDTLRLKTRMVEFKNKNSRGQREGTRSRTIISRVHNRARKYAACYRAARAAKLILTGPGEWEKVLQVLHDADIRSYQDPEQIKSKRRRRGTYEDSELQEMEVDDDDNGEGDGDDDGQNIHLLPENQSKRDGTGRTRQTLSWIWTTRLLSERSSNTKADGILRSEWCRSRARVKRATEEVQLLREEMRRVLAFLDWKASWWTLKQTARSVKDAALTEGLRAYCSDQASRQLALKASFCDIWKTPLENTKASCSDANDNDNKNTNKRNAGDDHSDTDSDENNADSDENDTDSDASDADSDDDANPAADSEEEVDEDDEQQMDEMEEADE